MARDLDNPGQPCRQSDDYYHSETCTTHFMSYMDHEDTQCERARLNQAETAVQRVREVCGMFAADIDVPVNVVLFALDQGGDA